jgi:hypothetical protein
MHIIKGHGGGVVLAVIRYFTLHLWSSSERSSTGTHTWKPHIIVNLATLLSLDTSFPYCAKFGVRILCTIDDRDIVVLWAKEGVF